jgi:hypothetical protein
MKPTVPRFIVCAAIRSLSGRIICGARHYDPIMRAQIIASEGVEVWRSADQGFIDNFGTFIPRKEAFVIAQVQGQLRYRFNGDQGTLYSENLY